MKEFTIEQKAQKYDEAIERANSLLSGNQIGNAWIYKLLPELKESKDEKIKRFLLESFKSLSKACTNGFYRDDITYKDVVAWLEKQSTPQVRTGLEWVNTIDDACDKRYAEEYAQGEYCHEQSFKWGFQEGVDWLEKQDEQKSIDNMTQQEAMDIAVAKCFNEGEQKLVDNAEPKFKVGDWITDGNITIQIEAIKNNCYLYCGDCALYSTKTADKVYHIWTIQDAKDGDVLACESGWTCIFKALDNHTNTFSSYCFMDSDKWFCNTGSECHTLREEFVKAYNGKIHPATKEQSDLLFQKMKEAGYKWNAELKKIEQEPAENKGMNLVEEEMTPFQKKVFCIIDTTIEEEQGLKQVCDELFALASNEIKQKPAEWSEEDKVILNNIIWGVRMKFIKPLDEMDDRSKYKKYEDFLKSLPKRFSLHPRQELSEEDETVLNNLIYALANDRIGNDRDEYVSWLKSLKDRYTWKPSEGQLECLGYAIEKAEKDWSPLTNNRIYLTLKALKEQLLELKGSKV